MNLKVNGVTLKAVNYKESDKILTVFTLERGKITISARGVRKANARMRGLSEPFCFAETVVAEKAGRYTAAEVNVFDCFYDIRLSLDKYYAGLCALEFTDAFFPEETVSEEQFTLLVEFLKKLCKSETPKILLAEFFCSALKISGYGVSFSQCFRCGRAIADKVYFSASEGSVVCSDCAAGGDKEFSYDTYSYLKTVAEKGDISRFSPQTVTNGLKFFGHYVTTVAGVTLKCMPPLFAV